MSKIGILHPGEMGISIAASAINNGHQAYWMSLGRSDKDSRSVRKDIMLLKLIRCLNSVKLVKSYSASAHHMRQKRLQNL